MTFYANDLEQTRNALLVQPFYTKQIEKHSKLIKQFNIYLEDKINNFKNIFEFYNVSPNIYLSLSITQNRRGFYIKDYFTAIVRLPKNSAEFNNSLYRLFMK